MARPGNYIQEVRDKELPQDTLRRRQEGETSSLFHFARTKTVGVYLGYGPTPAMALQVFRYYRYDGNNNLSGYAGDWPVEEQPTLPDVPPYLRQYKR